MSYTYAEGFIDAASDTWTCTPAAATKTGSTYTYSGALTPEQVNSPDFNVLIAETAGADGAVVDLTNVTVSIIYEIPLKSATQVGRHSDSYSSVAYGGGNTMVICGANGTIVQSTDSGSSWTDIPSDTSADLRKVYWDGAQFTIVGDAGVILTSPDGASWTKQNSGVASTIMGIAKVGTRGMIVVGAQDIDLYTRDKAIWL